MSLTESTVEETVRAHGMTETGKGQEGEGTYWPGRMHGGYNLSELINDALVCGFRCWGGAASAVQPAPAIAKADLIVPTFSTELIQVILRAQR